MKKTYILAAVALLLVIACVVTVLVVDGKNYEELSGWQRWLYMSVNREEIQNTKFVGEVSTEIWDPESEYRTEDHVLLLKDSDKDFVVMNIADLHMAEYSYTYLNSVLANRSLYYIKMMAEELQPDLITFSGDNFCEDGESNIYMVHRLTEYMDDLGIPWAPIFDEHDKLGNCDLNYICDVMMRSKYCVLRKGDPNLGVGNYMINIGQEANGRTEIIHSLFMMHSDHGNLQQNQIDWYRWAAAGVSSANGKAVTSSVILHVPYAQYQYAFDEAWDAENGCWKEGYEAFGVKGEDMCGERDENGVAIDNGFFAALKEMGTTNTICGHDHVNSYSILYEGVRLTYSLRMGLGGYWDDTFETDNCGATLLTIDADGNGIVSHYYFYSELYPDGVRAD